MADPRAKIGELRQLNLAPPPPPAPTGPSTEVNVDRAAGERTPDTPSPEPAGRQARTKVTSVYLPAATKALLDRAKAATRTSYSDLILEAVRARTRELRAEEPLAALSEPVDEDPDLPLPPARPTRLQRSVEDARSLQLRLTPEESAGLRAIAEQLRISVSELVTATADRHYNEAERSTT